MAMYNDNPSDFGTAFQRQLKRGVGIGGDPSTDPALMKKNGGIGGGQGGQMDAMGAPQDFSNPEKPFVPPGTGGFNPQGPPLPPETQPINPMPIGPGPIGLGGGFNENPPINPMNNGGGPIGTGYNPQHLGMSPGQQMIANHNALGRPVPQHGPYGAEEQRPPHPMGQPNGLPGGFQRPHEQFGHNPNTGIVPPPVNRPQGNFNFAQFGQEGNGAQGWNWGDLNNLRRRF